MLLLVLYWFISNNWTFVVFRTNHQFLTEWMFGLVLYTFHIISVSNRLEVSSQWPTDMIDAGCCWWQRRITNVTRLKVQINCHCRTLDRLKTEIVISLIIFLHDIVYMHYVCNHICLSIFLSVCRVSCIFQSFAPWGSILFSGMKHCVKTAVSNRGRRYYVWGMDDNELVSLGRLSGSLPGHNSPGCTCGGFGSGFL